MNSVTTYALITGGSQGLGKAIAEILASKGINLILVALPEKSLQETAKDIKEKFGVDVQTIGIDLTEFHATQKVFDFVRTNNLKVRYLINNAGIGYTESFEKLPFSFIDKLLKINVLSVTQLTHLFIPLLTENAPAYILNIASMAGLFTMPYKTAYSASKHYVVEFSLALREELKSKNINVTVVCPGGMTTNAEVLERINQMGKLGNILTASPELVAQVAIRSMFASKSLVVPKWQVRLYSYLRWIFPKTWQAKIIARTLREKLT
ncbi:MAG: SDR family NAD(P)-dependent oxidoreductase [Raineya sp.]|nr:SDR family NAD(P)-dependent oxidoreductase [Raineya sp.]